MYPKYVPDILMAVVDSGSGLVTLLCPLSGIILVILEDIQANPGDSIPKLVIEY